MYMMISRRIFYRRHKIFSQNLPDVKRERAVFSSLTEGLTISVAGITKFQIFLKD